MLFKNTAIHEISTILVQRLFQKKRCETHLQDLSHRSEQGTEKKT